MKKQAIYLNQLNTVNLKAITIITFLAIHNENGISFPSGWAELGHNKCHTSQVTWSLTEIRTTNQRPRKIATAGKGKGLSTDRLSDSEQFKS